MRSEMSVKVLSAAMALTVFLSGSAMAAMFADTGGHWAESAIDSLNRQGVMSGYSDGRFNPEGLITRAEFAATLVKANGWQNDYVDNGSNFQDVPRNFWAYRAIETVSDKGVVSGYPGGQFRPHQNISRAEVMAILVNSGRIPLPDAQATNNILSRYSDAGNIPQWARPHVAAAIQSGLFVNYPNSGSIEPTSLASRGEVAAMTGNLLNFNMARRQQPGSIGAAPSYGGNPQLAGNANASNWVRNDQLRGDTLHGYVSVVPAKTVFTASVMSNISSDRSRIGDPVAAMIDRPIMNARGEVVIPEGSQLQGEVTKVRQAGRTERAGEIDVNFRQITTPDGQTFPVTVEFNTDEGTLKSGTTKGRLGKTVGRTVLGGALGSGMGAILGGIKGDGKADDYLARGAVIGGALGAATAVAGKGDEVVVTQGELVELRFRQPLTIQR